MATSFRNNMNNSYDLLSGFSTIKNSNIQTKSEKEQYKNLKFYPFSTKE